MPVERRSTAEDIATLMERSTYTARTLTRIEELLEHFPSLVQDVADMKPQVEDFQRLKQRGWGIIIGAGLLTGSAGGALAKLIDNVLSGSGHK